MLLSFTPTACKARQSAGDKEGAIFEQLSPIIFLTAFSVQPLQSMPFSLPLILNLASQPQKPHGERNLVQGAYCVNDCPDDHVAGMTHSSGHVFGMLLSFGPHFARLLFTAATVSHFKQRFP
jgi:hypothetical protein